MKKLLLVSLLVVFLGAFLCADVYIKTNTHTDAFEMMGQKTPAKDTISEQWLGKDKFAMVSPQQSIVLDLGKSIIYMINHSSKSYLETKLPLDMSSLLPDMMAQMIQGMQIGVKVNPNGQSKTVDKWKCSGYDVQMDISGMMPMKMNMVIWASPDVPFDLKFYQEKLFPSIMKASMVQMKITDDMFAEFKKIKGFQIASDMTMSIMGAEMKMNTKVVEISKKSPPAGIYSVPDGYTKKDKFTMQDMQQNR